MKFEKALLYIIAIVLLSYLGWLLVSKKDYRVGEAAVREKYYKLINDSTLKYDWWNLKCTVDIDDSLGQGLHIVREGNSASCVEEVRGDSYNALKKPFLCNSEDARRIDEAVRGKNCTFQLGKALGNDVLNYHAFVLVCVADLTNWSYAGGGECPSDYAQSVIYGVVDDKGNVFY